ncbi:TrbG/VirB9 family P-type conjugative transfer protein [Brevundimonas pondensis]|uniref:TrbG/VirB9 family P-type conjugative transfer protein n=1 Tax=Brevundimonas pondensis TaxID=2774189 RepID=UPI0032089B0B
MDPRRLLTPTIALAAAGSLLAGCAALPGGGMSSPEPDAASEIVLPVEEAPVVPAEPVVSPTEVPYLAATNGPPSPVVEARVGPSGRAAIAMANQAARSPSRADGFVGGVQIFAWSPGRVFEVWTAPLRVTTLTLGEGETLVSKAAGDTIRWQIGEVASGSGAARRTHVLLKPLERGLETNLVLTTDRRVYLLDLKSGAADAFNAAIAWDEPETSAAGAIVEEPKGADPLVTPQGPLDARYRIEPQGRRARWTPSSVFNDGTRTFIAFDADLQVDEAPVLFVLTPGGEAQMVNYRQQGGLFVVDRLFDRAELRLGDRRPQVVRIHRLAGAGR